MNNRVYYQCIIELGGRPGILKYRLFYPHVDALKRLNRFRGQIRPSTPRPHRSNARLPPAPRFQRDQIVGWVSSRRAFSVDITCEEAIRDGRAPLWGKLAAP